jgi:hypothetical protein
VSAGRTGLCLSEAVVALAVGSLAALAVVPALERRLGAARAAAGAAHLVTTLQGLRFKSVASGTAYGLLFGRDAAGWRWHVVRDGNANGLRAAEVHAGTDPIVSGPHRLDDVASGTRLGFPPGASIPELPPGTGRLQAPDDPIKIGQTEILAFTPLGSSSSGTLYVTDGRRELYAVVLFGRTVRLRVWRYDAQARQWKL